MFEYHKVTDHSGYLSRTATDKTGSVRVVIRLENGLLSDEFADEFVDMETSDYKTIAVDTEDIYSILAGEDEAHFGRAFFGKSGKNYFTFDDLNWLRALKPRKVHLYIAGNITLEHVTDVLKLLVAVLPRDTLVLCSFEWQDLCVIKVDVLAV